MSRCLTDRPNTTLPHCIPCALEVYPPPLFIKSMVVTAHDLHVSPDSCASRILLVNVLLRRVECLSLEWKRAIVSIYLITLSRCVDCLRCPSFCASLCTRHCVSARLAPDPASSVARRIV